MAHRSVSRVVVALRADQRGHVGLHQGGHHLQASADSRHQQTLLHVLAISAIITLTCSGSAAKVASIPYSWPLAERPTPTTAGIERGPAISSSTTRNNLPGAGRVVVRHHMFGRLEKEGTLMPKFIMLTKLTNQGAQTLHTHPERMEDVYKEIEELGVKRLASYAILGPWDFINILEAPDNGTIAHLSVDLASRGTSTIATYPIVEAEQFIARLTGDHQIGKN